METQNGASYGIFKKAVNEQKYLKAGILGFPGAGKTHTAALLAIGLVKSQKLTKPVAVLDTESGSDYLIPLFEKEGVELVTSKSRAFVDLMAGLREGEKMASVVIIDSITHFWRELCESYGKVKQKRQLGMKDWVYLKAEFARYTDLYLNAKVHSIVCGRAAYEYDFTTDEDGKKEMSKTGTKMSVESNFGYEPSLLIEMFRDDVKANDGGIVGKMSKNIAYVRKDRTNTIMGKRIEYPTYNDFLPVFDFLSGATEHRAVDESRTSTGLFSAGSEDNVREREMQKTIVLEEIENELTHIYPGQSVEAKTNRGNLVKSIFDTRSWTAITQMDLAALRAGYEKLLAVSEPASASK